MTSSVAIPSAAASNSTTASLAFSLLGRCHDLDLQGVAEPAHDLVA
jgi:hypothetical protein